MSRRFVALIVAFVAGCSPAPSTESSKTAQAASFVPQPQPAAAVSPQPAVPVIDEALAMYQRYGAPNKDYNNQIEVPRPKVARRWLDYNAAKVRFFYAYDNGWRLTEAADLENGDNIGTDEASRRFQQQVAKTSVPVVRQSDPPKTPKELDPGTMFEGDVGTLPRTTARFHYLLPGAVYDDGVLVLPEELQGNAWEPVTRGRFFLQCDVASTLKGMSHGEILLPGVYTVVGTKTTSGGTFPRIKRTN